MWSLSWVQCQWSLNARVLCWLCNLSPFIKRILFSINSHAACNSCSLAIHWLKYLSSCYILLIMIQDFKRHVQKTMCMSLTGFIFLTFIEKLLIIISLLLSSYFLLPYLSVLKPIILIWNQNFVPVLLLDFPLPDTNSNTNKATKKVTITLLSIALSCYTCSVIMLFFIYSIN